jgi:hypothetical protein
MPHITSAGPHHMASAGGNGHAGGVIVLALLVIIIVAAGVMAASPRWTRQLPRFTAAAVGGLLAAYEVARGIVEFFLIHYSQPEVTGTTGEVRVWLGCWPCTAVRAWQY